MLSKIWLTRAVTIPLAGALAFSVAPPAIAMTNYASPAILKPVVATSAQPVAYYYRHWRHHNYGGAVFAATALGLIAAIAASSSHDCDWGSCGDYGYDTGGPYYGYGGPYYGGWAGHRHWGGGHAYWGGHPHWAGAGGHSWHGHAFAGGGGPIWPHHRWR